MADITSDNITLITYGGSLVTPQHDALMADAELTGNGTLYGCEVSGSQNTLHITHGVGVIYGREFEITEHDITVDSPQSGSLLGQVFIRLNLSAPSPISIKVVTEQSLTVLEDNADINTQTTHTTEMQLATFSIDTSGISSASVRQTAPQITRVSNAIKSTENKIATINNTLAPIATHNVTYARTAEGDGIYLQGGGTTIIGAGEAAQKIIDNDINNAKAGNSESVHIAADNTVFLYSNCQSDISQRKGAVLTSAGNFNVLNGGITASGVIKSGGKTCFPITSRDVDINLHTASWSAATALYYTEIAVSGWQSIIGVSVEYWGALAGFVQPYIVNNGKIGLMSTVGSFPRTDATITVRIIGTRTSGD